MKITKNISQSTYDLVVGTGIWFSGIRIDASGESKPIKNPFQNLTKTLEQLKMDELALGQKWLYLFFDDCSPLKPSIDLDSLEDYIWIESETNVGIGDKENIIQSIGALYSNKVFRWDNDVFIKTSLKDLLEEDLTRTSCLGINAGFMGAMLELNNPGSAKVPTRQLGNAVLYNTEMFALIGYSSPLLHYFNDLDWFFKAWHNGMPSFMIMTVKGSALSSGGGCNMDKRAADAFLFQKLNPLASVRLNKIGKPIVTYNKNYDENSLFAKPVPIYGMSDTSVQILRLLKRKSK